jgi:DNA invertase Pin-like site-specific DNA recombinase
MKPKAYSYIRFSTPEQAEGDSHRRQFEAASAYADAEGLDLQPLTMSDLGLSAYHADHIRRGALGMFLSAIDNGDIEKGSFLLVENLDRLSRADPWEALPIFQQIINAGVTLVTLQDRQVYTREAIQKQPFIILTSLLMMVRAHEESQTKSRRLLQAWAEKRRQAAEQRTPMTARLPAWLELSADGETITINEDRADIVRRIYREADSGIGQHSIAEALNRDGVPTFGDGKRKAAFWHRSYIAKILANPATCGDFVPHLTTDTAGRRSRQPQKPIPGYFPRIVAKAQFERIQNRRAAGAVKMRAASGTVSNVLAGLAKCPQCGNSMTRVNKGRRGGTPYLVCTAAKARAGCSYRQVKLDSIERALRHHATRDLVHAVPAADEGLNERLEAAEAAVAGLDASIDALVDEIERGGASPVIRSRLDALVSQRDKLDEERQEARQKADAAGGRRLGRIVSALEDTLSSLGDDATAANLAMRDAFSSVTVDYDAGTMALAWRHAETPTVIPYTISD